METEKTFYRKPTLIRKTNNIPYKEKRVLRDAIVPGNIYLCQQFQFDKDKGYFIDYQPVLVIGKTPDGDINFLHLKPTANSKLTKEEIDYKSVIELDCEELKDKKFYVCANKIDTCPDELFFSRPIYRLQEKNAKVYEDIAINTERGISTNVAKYIKDKYIGAERTDKESKILKKILNARIDFLQKQINDIKEFMTNFENQKLVSSTLHAIDALKVKVESRRTDFNAHERNIDRENPLQPEETVTRLNNMFSSTKGKTLSQNDITKIESIAKINDINARRVDQDSSFTPTEAEKVWMQYGIPILPNDEKINLIQPGLVYPCEILAKNGMTRQYEIKSRPVLVIGQVSKNEIQIIHITTKQKLGKENQDTLKHIGHTLEKDRKEQNEKGEIANPKSFIKSGWLNTEKIETVPIETIIPIPTSYFSENKLEYRNRFLNILYNAEKRIVINTSKKIKKSSNTKLFKKHKSFLEKQLQDAIKTYQEIFGSENNQNTKGDSDNSYGSIIVKHNGKGKKPPNENTAER